MELPAKKIPSRVRRQHRNFIVEASSPAMRVRLEYASTPADPVRLYKLVTLLDELIRIHCR